MKKLRQMVYKDKCLFGLTVLEIPIQDQVITMLRILARATHHDGSKEKPNCSP
jgi:hypothetical protein